MHSFKSGDRVRVKEHATILANDATQQREFDQLKKSVHTVDRYSLSGKLVLVGSHMGWNPNFFRLTGLKSRIGDILTFARDPKQTIRRTCIGCWDYPSVARAWRHATPEEIAAMPIREGMLLMASRWPCPSVALFDYSREHAAELGWRHATPGEFRAHCAKESKMATKSKTTDVPLEDSQAGWDPPEAAELLDRLKKLEGDHAKLNAVMAERMKDMLKFQVTNEDAQKAVLDACSAMAHTVSALGDETNGLDDRLTSSTEYLIEKHNELASVVAANPSHATGEPLYDLVTGDGPMYDSGQEADKYGRRHYYDGGLGSLDGSGAAERVRHHCTNRKFPSALGPRPKGFNWAGLIGWAVTISCAASVAYGALSVAL